MSAPIRAANLNSMKDLTAVKIMSSPLVAVAPDDTLRLALELMEKQAVHHLLVVERGRISHGHHPAVRLRAEIDRLTSPIAG